MNVSTLVLLCASSFFSVSALAQWQWVDDQGHKVFSDRPPPAQVPANRIAQRPAAVKAPSAALPASPPPAASQASDRSPGVDPELQAKKTAEEAAQAEREQAQAQKKKQARMRQDNCARAQAALASLTDGRLLAHTNAKGERSFMDDSTRAAERQRAQAIIASDCGTAAIHGASTTRKP